jgi:hypothetical protein
MTPGLQRQPPANHEPAFDQPARSHAPGLGALMLPVLVCHGVPVVPSDDLFPLVEILQRPL